MGQHRGCNSDPSVFLPDADYSRPIKKSGIIAFTEFGLMRPEFFEATVPGIVGSILSLPDLKRGPGPSGKLTRFFEKKNGTLGPQYISMKGAAGPWSDSLLVEYKTQASAV